MPWVEGDSLSPANLNNRTFPVFTLKASGATGNGVVDDTAAIQVALTAGVGSTVLVSAGTYRISSTVTLPANTVMIADGQSRWVSDSTFTGSNVLSVSSGCVVHGLILDGNNSSLTGISIQSAVGVEISGCYVLNHVGHGIYTHSASSVLLQGNRIEGVTGGSASAIRLDYGSLINVIGNRIHNCWHGVTWWGGDAALASTRSVFHLTIVGNSVSSVNGGGIWGSLGQHIAVTGNSVVTAGDVCLDAEGSSYVVFSGNNVANGVNEAVASFHTSDHLTIANNVIDQTGSHGYGILFSGPNRATTDVLISGNIISGNTGIYNDPNSLWSSLIVGNLIHCSNATLPNAEFDGIVVNQAAAVDIIGNKIVTAGYNGIAIGGAGGCLVANNHVSTTTDTSSAGSHGGIEVRWVSSTYSGQRNTIRGNVIEGFVTSLNDHWTYISPGDPTSYNLFADNRCTNFYRDGSSSTWSGGVDNNSKLTDPKIPVPVSIY